MPTPRARHRTSARRGRSVGTAHPCLDVALHRGSGRTVRKRTDILHVGDSNAALVMQTDLRHAMPRITTRDSVNS